MTKYTKLPVEIEAVQFTGEREELERWITDNSGSTMNWFFDGGTYASFSIWTLEGLMEVNLGDYVIRGVKGEFYPCKEEIFNLSYVKSEED